jgi:hypothetical protein
MAPALGVRASDRKKVFKLFTVMFEIVMSNFDYLQLKFMKSINLLAALARHHTECARATTADRLNQFGHPRAHAITDKAKIRLPPPHQEMVQTGRRSSHLASWRGPCTNTARLSSTAHAMADDSTGRTFE